MWWHTGYEERLERSHYRHFNFHIISYNILAQQLIEDNPFLYDDCVDENLHWNRRKERLLHEIFKQDADVSSLRKKINQEKNFPLDHLFTRNAK